MAYTFQQAASNSTTGATSLAVTFANAPASGELIVATVATNSSTATITAPSGFSTKVSNANTSRSIGIYWKIAGSSESTSYTWNFSASIAAAIVMRRFSSNYGWNTDQSGGASNYAWDNTSVSSVSMSITTTANRLVVGDGYSSNTTSTNKQLNPNSNWLDNTLLYSNRTRSAYRTAAGGAETLGYQLTDAAVDTRLAIMAAEFVEYTTKTANASTKALSTSWNGRKYSDPSKVPSADTTPDAFSFTDQTGVALSSTITSAAITVSGINSAATITSSGGTFDINNSGTFISSGTVNNGDTVRARVTSSSSNSTAVNCVVTIGGVSDTFTATTLAASGVQLASGHYVPQKFAMTAVYPRPDSETGTYGATINARHRWAYYDGTNAIQYEIPLKIYGGSAPHMFSITSQPSGETATIGNTYGDDSSHGVFKWTPSRAFTTSSPASFTVRVTGQDGNTLDVSWTVATDSSTNRFVFVSNSGNNANSGAISSPFATLAKVTGGGSTKTTTTYPGRIVYMRGGNYATVAHTDAWNGGNGSETQKCRIELSATYHPMAYLAYPGETVNIDFSGAEVTIEGDDCLWSGSSTSKMVIQGSATNAAETHNFWMYENKRIGYQWIDFDGFIPRTAGNFTNSCPIFASGSNATPTRNYIHAHNVREINRTATAANDGMLWVLFGTKYWVDEYCSGSRSGGPGAAMKDTCYSTSTRYLNVVLPAESFGYAFMGQNGSGDNEICFSRVSGPLWFNFQANSSVTTQCSYRNTVYTTDNNYSPGIRAWPATGPFSSDGDCVISVGSPGVAAGGSGMATIATTGTECQSTTASSNKPFNTSSGLLQNVVGGTQWRDLYYGTRGWEIA